MFFFLSFFLFVVVLVVVGLARDGCLVRSWLGDRAAWGCRRPASEAWGVEICFKSNLPPPRYREVWGGSFSR